MRSVTAFVVGCATMIALSAMGNAVIFHGGTGAHMPPILAAMLLIMRGLAAIAGGYLAGTIAEHRPLAHGLAAGVLYVLALQLEPHLLRVLLGAPTAQSLGTAAAAIGVTLVGAAVGGGARAQLRHSALEH